MNSEEFRERLKSSADKIGELKNRETLNSLNFSISVFVDIISEIMNDEEKCQFLNAFKFHEKENKIRIIKSLNSDELKVSFLMNDEFYFNHFMDIVLSMTDNGKSNVLANEELREKYKPIASNYDSIIFSMSDQEKEKQIKMEDKMKNLYGNNYQSHILSIIIRIKDDDKKIRLAEECNLDISDIFNVIMKVSDEKKRVYFYQKNLTLI